MVLTEKTKTTVGFLVVVVSAVVWLNSKFDDVNSKSQASIEPIRTELTTVKSGLRDVTYTVDRLNDRLADQWTRPQMESLMLRFARDNPSLRVPEVR